MSDCNSKWALKLDTAKWVIVTPNEPFVSNIMVRTSYIWWEGDDVCFVLYQHAYLLAPWNNSPHIDMSLHSWRIILIPSQTVSVLTPPSLVNTCFMVNSWFDPTSLVLLVEKTEENNRPVRKSLTNYREVVSSTPRQRKRLEEHFLLVWLPIVN